MAIVFATVAPIRLVRGTRWTDQLQLVNSGSSDPVDLAGIESLVLRIRRTINGPILLELDLGNGLTLLNPSTALIGIDVASARTLTLPEAGNRRAKYLFDAVIERTPGEYEAAVTGKLTVLPSITRPWADT